MKFLRLIVRNAFRNKRRTILTALSIAISLFVFASTRNVITAFEAWDGQAATHSRIVVQSALGLGHNLPIGMERELRERCRPMAELNQDGHPVMHKLNWFGGYVNDPKDWFANFGSDVEGFREMWDELTILDETYEAWRKNERGAIVGEHLLKRMQDKGIPWRVGSKTTLVSSIYPCKMEDLEIVGTFRAKTPVEEDALYFHWNYFNRQNGERGEVGTYWIKARTLDDMARLKSEIDGKPFASGDPTETLSEREFAAQFRSMMGNVTGLIAFFGTVIVFVLVFVAANTIAMTARERVTEVAVLRTLGFTRGKILFLFLAESVVVSLLGAALAAALSFGLYNVAGWSPSRQFFPSFAAAPKTLGLVLAIGVAVGLIAAAVPAIRAARRTIVEGLRFVA